MCVYNTCTCTYMYVRVYMHGHFVRNATDSAAIPPPSSLSSTANDHEPKSEDKGDKGTQT